MVVLKGKPFVDIKGKINTRIPADRRLQGEMKEYAKGVLVYWGPKSRTSHAVLEDIIVDLKKWLRGQGETEEVVVGMDNLGEQTCPRF
jgi:hypothetical protein